MRAGGDSPELWRVEAACRDVWPAAQEVACGDWILRRSGGTTRRTNSANPIRWPAADIASTLERAHAFDTRHDQRLVFRVPSFLVEVVDELTGAGLTPRAETTTLRLETALEDHPRDPAVEVTTSATERWREARKSIAPSDPDQRRKGSPNASCRRS